MRTSPVGLIILGVSPLILPTIFMLYIIIFWEYIFIVTIFMRIRNLLSLCFILKIHILTIGGNYNTLINCLLAGMTPLHVISGIFS